MFSTQIRRFFTKVNIADVKKLRELTSAPVSDIKNALIESKNDISAAKKILIKRNLIFSEKKEGREQKEGVWGFKTNADRTKAVMVNLTCETDFVAKSHTFIKFCQESLDTILKAEDFHKIDSTGECEQVKAWMNNNEFSNSGNNVTDAKKLLIANMEENIEFHRIHTVEVPDSARIGYYIHRTFEDSVGHSGNYVVVDLSSEIDASNPIVNRTIDNLAVHCFSNRPQYLYETSLPEEMYAEIQALVRQRMAKAIEGKPEKLQQIIMRGALLKQLESKEIMEHQKLGFIDSEETIGQYLADIHKKIGGELTVQRYHLFE